MINEIEICLPSVSTIYKVLNEVKPNTTGGILRYASDLIMLCCPIFQDPRLMGRVLDVLTIEEVTELTNRIIKEIMNNETNYCN